MCIVPGSGLLFIFIQSPLSTELRSRKFTSGMKSNKIPTLLLFLDWVLITNPHRQDRQTRVYLLFRSESSCKEKYIGKTKEEEKRNEINIKVSYVLRISAGGNGGEEEERGWVGEPRQPQEELV